MSDDLSTLRPQLVAGDKTLTDVTDDICAPMAGRPGGLWWAAFAVALTALIIGVVAVTYQIAYGIGTWGLNKTVGWAFDITNFVFWVGIGHAGTLISAGSVFVSAKMANRSQPLRRSDDAFRSYVRGYFPAHSYGPALASILDAALREHTWATLGQLQIAAIVGRFCNFNLPHGLGFVLVCRPVARLGDHSRSLQTWAEKNNHIDSLSWLEWLHANVEPLRNGLHAFGRAGHAACFFSPYDCQHGLCDSRHSWLAYNHLSALLCRRGDFQRACDGANANDYRKKSHAPRRLCHREPCRSNVQANACNGLYCWAGVW